MGEEKTEAVYTHGHHPSVLRSHSWRTVANSAEYLIKYLKPDMYILDVGCGPGTISIDLAANYVSQGKVLATDYAEDVLKTAKASADEQRIKNIEFETADIHNLHYPDNTFDVVHAHQVLQHITDPVKALQEMLRVVKPGGFVAARDTDYESFEWYPDIDGMDFWKQKYLEVARANGGDPLIGKYLHAVARRAGYDHDRLETTAGVWCYTSKKEVAWWSDLWAERTLKSSFATTAKTNNIATQEDLERIAKAWENWGKSQDPRFILVHGQIVYQK
ncbi:hypothetical protein TRICI_000960 [Trichomonascus ciferrii]|uniref:Methyltransferase domain-containing protein n=1 Tax=Trichomonascus ciferrii TaxID=44093 RepID=A0A642VAI9_9ASCO|nr:hypothetical protein TRICI_000960 [Trichomonascus ciferrii]